MFAYLSRALTGVLLVLSASLAQAHDMSAHAGMTSSSSASGVYHTEGTIKSVSPRALTISHQAISALNWPPMTMRFAPPEGEALPPVAVGDKVAFSFTRREGGYQIISLTPLR